MCALSGVSALADTDTLTMQSLPAIQDSLNMQDIQIVPDTLDTQATSTMPSAPGRKTAKPEDRSDKVPHRYPMAALALSAVFPGGGQLYTQKYFRAAAFAGAIAYFGYGYYREDRAIRRELTETPLTLSDSLAHAANYDFHYESRRGYMWWGIGIWLFSMADAYVDAHMFKFDERAQEPTIGLRATPNSLALSAKF